MRAKERAAGKRNPILVDRNHVRSRVEWWEQRSLTQLKGVCAMKAPVIFLVLLAACTPQYSIQSSEVVEVYVNENMPVSEAYRRAGLELSDPSIVAFDKPEADRAIALPGTKRRMQVVLARESGRLLKKKDSAYRPVTAIELFALATQHRPIVAERKGVCATGGTFADSNGEAGFYAVVSDGRALGLRKDCNWVVLVLKGG